MKNLCNDVWPNDVTADLIRSRARCKALAEKNAVPKGGGGTADRHKPGHNGSGCGGGAYSLAVPLVSASSVDSAP